MRSVAWLVVVLSLAFGQTRSAGAQSAAAGPSFPDVQVAWSSFWARIAEDDLAGARRYLHSSVRARFPGNRSLQDWRDVALQMAFCRLEPTPFMLGPDEATYPARCQQGDEQAETLVIVRRDLDGVWRFTAP